MSLALSPVPRSRCPDLASVGRVRRDRAEDYAALRRRVFKADRVPLPKSLTLSSADEALNRTARL